MLCVSFFLQACPIQDDGDIQIGLMNLENHYEETIYYCMNYSVLERGVDETCFKYVVTLLEYPIHSKENEIFKIYKGMFTDNRKIQLLIFKQSTLDEHSWEEIQERNLFDKRYSLTVEDLKELNWTITYDGD